MTTLGSGGAVLAGFGTGADSAGLDGGPGDEAAGVGAGAGAGATAGGDGGDGGVAAGVWGGGGVAATCGSATCCVSGAFSVAVFASIFSFTLASAIARNCFVSALAGSSRTACSRSASASS